MLPNHIWEEGYDFTKKKKRKKKKEFKKILEHLYEVNLYHEEDHIVLSLLLHEC